jgi:hypothetical protein
MAAATNMNAVVENTIVENTDFESTAFKKTAVRLRSFMIANLSVVGHRETVLQIF